METSLVVLLVLCLLVGTGNLALFALVLRGHLRPRLLRQEFVFKHDFAHRFLGLGKAEEEEAVPQEAAETARPDGETEEGPLVVAKLRERGFVVHFLDDGESPAPESHRLGEILLRLSPDDDLPCPNCGIQTYDFREVIDREGENGFETVWQEFGAVCVACGHFRRYDEDLLLPRGVFRYGPDHEGDLVLFLEEFPAEAVNERARNAYRQALAEQERLLMSRVFAVRQQIANADLALLRAEREEGHEEEEGS